MVSWKRMKVYVIPLFYFILALLFLRNDIEPLTNKIGLNHLSDINIAYLQTSFAKSVKGFLLLSSMKSGLAIIEGSGVGIGFNLQIGDIVQSVYDYLDIAWKTSLAGSTVLLVTRLVYQTIIALDHIFLSLFFFSLGLLALCTSFLIKKKTLTKISRELVLWTAIAAVLIYLVLPLSIAGASFLSHRITQPLIDEAFDGFQSVEKSLSLTTTGEDMLNQDESKSDLLDKLNLTKHSFDAKRKILEMYTILKHKIDDLADWTIKLIAGYLFDCIVFPASLFILFFIVSKAIISYVLGLRRDKSFKDDLEEILGKFYRQASPKSVHSD